MELIFPVDEIAITQGYHSGYCLDLGTISGHKKNAPVFPCADGIIYKNEYQSGGGYVTYVLHDNGWVSHYAHCKKDSFLKVGTKVNHDDQIAIKDKTGNYANAVHLHFGIWKDKKYIGKKTKSTMIPILDYIFMDEDQITSKTTGKKYDLLKYGETRTCTASTLRVRKAPSLTAKQVSHIKKGDKVKIYEYENGFYKLSADNTLWAYAKYLK